MYAIGSLFNRVYSSRNTWNDANRGLEILVGTEIDMPKVPR